jgi:hypothetical protein
MALYALTAWQRFLVYVGELPPSDQAALWDEVRNATPAPSSKTPVAA